MLEIPGIDAEKVELYGNVFLKLIKNAQQVYESMMQQQEDRVQDPNHINVINISDDDESGDYDLDAFEDEASQRERSTYFPSREVEAFNAQCGYSYSNLSDSLSDNSFSVADAAPANASRAVSKPRR